MCRVTLILVFHFVAQLHANEVGVNQIPKEHSAMENSVDKPSDQKQRSIGKIVDINHLFNRVLMLQLFQQDDMDGTTLGKPGPVQASRPLGLLGPPRASWGVPVSPGSYLHQPQLSSLNGVAKVSTFGARSSRLTKVHASTVEKTSEQTAQSFATVANYPVLRASDNSEVTLTSLLAKDKKTVFAFLTHFGDFNCWELAQRLIFTSPEFADANADIRMVGIGSVESARKFASMLDIDAATVYADPTASIYKALGYARGFMPESDLNGYVKMFPMLLGISSPGTIQAVLRGYRGDSQARRDWVSSSLRQGTSQDRFPSYFPEGSEGVGLWNLVGKEGLRPFELATLRLQNMVGVLGNWDELAPKDDQLVVQQGGTMVVRPDGSTAFAFADRGILTYADVDELLAQVKSTK